MPAGAAAKCSAEETGLVRCSAVPAETAAGVRVASDLAEMSTQHVKQLQRPLSVASCPHTSRHGFLGSYFLWRGAVCGAVLSVGLLLRCLSSLDLRLTEADLVVGGCRPIRALDYFLPLDSFHIESLPHAVSTGPPSEVTVIAAVES